MTTKNYDPIETGGLTPAAARRALARLKADILSDDDHPFNHPQHFQHEDFVETFRTLNRMVRADDEDSAREADAAFLSGALSDEEPCHSVAECRTRAAQLARTPGYVSDSPGVRLSELDRERIRKKIHAFHVVASRAEALERAAAEAARARGPEAEDAGDAGTDTDEGDEDTDDGGWSD